MFEIATGGPCLVRRLKWGAMAPCLPPPHPPSGYAPVRYERQLKSVKQIDNEMANLMKSNFNDKIAIILQEQ